MKLRSLLLLTALYTYSVQAQDSKQKPINITFEARGDFRNEKIDGKTDHENSGFKGTNLNLILKGNIGKNFSYMYRQRLNGINKDYSFFDATDWLYLSYHINNNFTLTAGKWAVMVGGWDFDPAPIDVFQLYEFPYNFPCYEWGVWGSYDTNNKKDKIIAQFVESPFQKMYNHSHNEKTNLYAYNLIWYGSHGRFHTDWSVNMMEYAPNKYINYIALGTRYDITNKLQVQVDVMNRAAKHQVFFFKDCSISGRVDYQPSKHFNIWTKASYDVNQTNTDADKCVLPNTEITRLGVGMEYFPLTDQRVRLHANYSYAFGENTNENGYLKDKQSMIDLGVTWRMKVL